MGSETGATYVNLAHLPRTKISPMRNPAVVDYMMKNIPREWWRICKSWACACLGCANRASKKFSVTEEEFEDWKRRHGYCEHCNRMNE